MIHHDDQFAVRVEALVTEIETRTDAEIVVVAADRSETYRDVRILSAGIAAMLTLVVLVEIPAFVPPIWAIVDMIGMAFLVGWICNANPILRRLVRRHRKDAAATRAAAAEFHLEAVHATPHRTGVLIYVTALEGRVELIPDIGLKRRIPEGLWAPAKKAFHHEDLDHFLEGLRRMGEVLATHIPKLEHDAVDLPNAPRIRR